ncbi:MAG: SDR family oxidoreductase [Kiloniellales bacterium]|nr:SDR family oxidoreductase [Kiloniellales bacterium]
MKRILVTGGTSGIGLAIARGFAEAGWRVTAAGLGAEAAGAAGLELVELDVTEAEAVRTCLAGFDRLDALVNAAGVIRRHEELEPDVFEAVVDVNLNGTMRCCATARPLLAASRGSVINIASMLSFFGGGVVPGYAASKGGIAQLTKSLAIAWAGEGIRVNALAPGWIATPLTQPLRDDPARERAILSRTPMGRWGRPEELVGPALFLASEAASFVTGAVLTVDGGYSIM